jgi:hypothetical protein
MPGGGNRKKSPADNIYSWVHKEFKENDINAHKHRLLCKLDDMSHGTRREDILASNRMSFRFQPVRYAVSPVTVSLLISDRTVSNVVPRNNK